MKNYLIILLLVSLLFSCKTHYGVKHVQKQRYSISNQENANPKFTAIIKPYKVKLDSEMNKILSYS